MRLSSLIGHVAELLESVLRSREPADVVTARFFRARRYLGARDRRFIADHLFGILRDRLFLEAVTREALGRSEKNNPPERLPPLALALTRILRSGITLPDAEREALHSLWDAPEAHRVMSADLLEEAAQKVATESDPHRRISTVYSMPEDIVREWIERYGEQETTDLCDSLNTPAPTTARVNTLRCTIDECRGALESAGLQIRPGTFLPGALVFSKRPTVQTLEPFRQGWFEMQDEGSQMISVLLNPLPGELVVDACAGAGGKTLHCAALMRNRGRIIAADRDSRKLGRLLERARRAGASIIEVAPEGVPPRSLSGMADAVLVDAPCSGVGTLRRNPGAKSQLSGTTSHAYAATQLQILLESAKLVRPGGRLLYATCTLLHRENEEIVERFCSLSPEFSVVPVQRALTDEGFPEFAGPYLTLAPHRHGTDGFFAALLRRRS